MEQALLQWADKPDGVPDGHSVCHLMKAAFNGVPNLSALDGWWSEGWVEGVTGWAIGDGGPGENDAGSLYDKLERVVLPLYYENRTGWIAVMKGAISIRDLSAALPARANELSPDQRKQIEFQVKFVATLAQRLDASGDSDDRAGAELNLTKIEGVLATLQTLFAAPASE